ncbi:MAG: OmpA family protein [Acidobacteria bacterium]|nr:OmpA family protein [Acidobacteriota bacterium]
MQDHQRRLLTIIFVTTLALGAAACAKPKVQLQVSRDHVQQGEDVRLTWTSKDAKNVTINGDKVDQSGSKVYTPNDTTTYTAVATRGKKEARDSKTVNVTARPAAPSVTINADQSAIERGQSTTLRWSSTNADRVTITDLGAVPDSGSRAVSPSQSTTFTATALGPGGSSSASTRVTVTEATPIGVPGDRPRTTTTPTNTAIATLFNQWVLPIYFALDKAELTTEAQETLRKAAQWLTQGPNRSIAFRIEGNCDPRGTEEYNIGLGERRAQAAREFLVNAGVETQRIQTVSYGEEKATGTNEASWAKDRRDDFIYVSGGTSARN